MSVGIKFTGINELQVKLKGNMDMKAVRAVVKKNGSELQTGMQRHAVFTKGYSTGATRRSIGLQITNGGMTATVEPKTEYSPYVEYGTRYMAAEPFVGPAFNAQKGKFISDLEKLVR